MQTRIATRGRLALDRRLAALRPTQQWSPPPKGWIKALREALLMSQADLASRMGISQAGLAAMERTEASGTIQLDTLGRVAEALDCELVYALIPRSSLDATVHAAARAKLAGHLQAVAQTMSLEDQPSTPDDDVVTDEVQRLIASGRIWK